MKMTPSEQIMYNVLHITILDDKHTSKGTATGFLFGFCENGDNHILCLVTNRHVLSICSNIRITFTRTKSNGLPDIGNLLQVDISTNGAIFHPNSSIDLAVLPISDAVNSLLASGLRFHYVMLTKSNIPTQTEWKQFSAIENVVMPGFPKGLRDEVNNQPIIRSGITATHPSLDFRGHPEFLVDMPCYEGCSGSPVLICTEGLQLDKRNRRIAVRDDVKLLGIQYAIPLDRIKVQLELAQTTSAAVTPVVPLYLNLGFIIKSTELLAFESIIKAKFNLNSTP